MSTSASPAAKTERLLNLVMCLLYTRRPLPKARLRELVPQYAAASSDESFDRMFERDKDELRELGIPLVVEEINGVWEDDTGYRIHQRDYALPDIDFTPQERAALGLAARAWAQGSLAGDAAAAIRKLQAAGVERDEESLVGIEPRLRTAEPAFDALRGAVTTSTPVRFGYRRADGESATRSVQPWGLASRNGRWYLTGFDLDRQDERVFRLSRITGRVQSSGRPGSYAIPDSHDVRAAVTRSARRDQATIQQATVQVRTDRGQALRRRGRPVEADMPGWTVLELDLADVDTLADELTDYGADVVVQGPPSLREAVIGRLRSAAAVHGELS